LIGIGAPRAEWLTALAQIHERLDEDDLASLVAADRSAAGMPPPVPDALRRAVENLVEVHAEALSAGAARLGPAAGSQLLSSLITGTDPTEQGRSNLLRLAAAAWGRETASQTVMAEERATQTENSLARRADESEARQLAGAITEWALLTAPQRAADAAAALLHPPTQDVVLRWRRLALDLTGKRNAPTAALPIVEALATNFGTLPDLGPRLQEDLKACRDLAREASLRSRPEVSRLERAIAAAKADLAGLARCLDGSEPTALASSTVAELIAAFRAAAQALLSPLPWLSLREFVLWLHNEQRQTAPALSLARVMQRAIGDLGGAVVSRDARLAELQEQIQADVSTLHRELAGRKLEAALKAGRLQDALVELDTLLKLPAEASARAELETLRATLQAKLRARRGSQVFWWSAAAVVLVLFLVASDDWRTPTPPNRPVASSSYPSAPPQPNAYPSTLVSRPPPTDMTEARPIRGSTLPLTLPELRWCEFQKRRIPAARAAVTGLQSSGSYRAAEIDPAIARINAVVDAYNGACVGRTYYERDKLQVDEQTAGRGPELDREGRQFAEAAVRPQPTAPRPTLPLGVAAPRVAPAPLPAAPPALERPRLPPFEEGRADRDAWERWFAAQYGDARAGAEWWAGQRSLPRPGTCESSNLAFTAGCSEAYRRLAPSDARRRSDPEYRRGWNNYGEPAALAMQPVATPTTVRPADVSASSSFQQGQSDRAAWEQWVLSLWGGQKAGAEYWASQRSLPRPGSCQSGDAAFAAGCAEAKRRLAPYDAQRRTDPEYRSGWNNY
jgi:hypothetical protein